MAAKRKEATNGPRRYSLKKLAEAPLTIPTCQGDVVIGSEHFDGKQRVTVKMPDATTTIDAPQEASYDKGR